MFSTPSSHTENNEPIRKQSNASSTASYCSTSTRSSLEIAVSHPQLQLSSLNPIINTNSSEYSTLVGEGGGISRCTKISTTSPSSSTSSTVASPFSDVEHVKTNSMCGIEPMHCYYTSSSSNRININKDEMKRYFNAPQVLAARMLNVSVSTLKRRYYETYKSRWPYQRLSNSERKKSIWYYVNEEDEPEKYISMECMKTLNLAFEDPTVQITRIKPVKEKQPSSSQRQFLSYIPPSETRRYDGNLTQITESTQIKGGSRQKYYIIGGKSSYNRRRGNKY